MWDWVKLTVCSWYRNMSLSVTVSWCVLIVFGQQQMAVCGLKTLTLLKSICLICWRTGVFLECASDLNRTPWTTPGSQTLHVRGCRTLAAYKALYSSPLCPRLPSEHTRRNTDTLANAPTHSGTCTSSHSTRGSHTLHTVITLWIQKESDTIGTQKHLIFIQGELLLIG